MIPAILCYLAAFALAWGPVITHGFPWTMALLLCPIAWVAAVKKGRTGALAPGLYAVVGVTIWASVSGAFLPALGAVVLALLAWDSAGLALWLRKADEVPDRPAVWLSMMYRSSGLAAGGALVALGFSQLQLSLPFWSLAGLLIGSWAALAVFSRRSSRQHSK